MTTAILVLSESSTLISILSRSFLLDEALLDVFDGTLLARNEAGVVAEGRELKSSGDPISKLGKLIKRCVVLSWGKPIRSLTTAQSIPKVLSEVSD